MSFAYLLQKVSLGICGIGKVLRNYYQNLHEIAIEPGFIFPIDENL